MLAYYQWDGEGDYVVGGWDGQMLWGAELFGELYGTIAESDLAKTQNSWVNNGQTNLQQLYISIISFEYELKPMLGVPVFSYI